MIFPKEKGEFISSRRWTSQSGRDQELRTPTLIREHPLRGEGNIDFLGAISRVSVPPPEDSLPDAGEASK